MDESFPDGDYEIVQYPFAMQGKRPKRMYVPKGDDVISTFMKTARPWEFGNLVGLYQQTARGGSFVEVGANIGTDTVLASDFFKNCYAFEPFPRHGNVFRKNMELNEITSAQLFPVAVSDQCGTTKLYFPEKHNTGSAALMPNVPGMDGYLEVPMVTLDSALPEVTDVTYLHIDAEGHDIKVLQGAKNFIARQTQRPFIKLEFQPGALSLHGSQIADLIAFMDDLQYRAMFNAASYLVPLSTGMLIEMFYSWRSSRGWIDIYLAPLKENGEVR
jgi:FkbM family methyltransferase